MDWNSKWDWENFVEFGSKATESRKNGASFNPSYSGVSAKNSLSASTDSSVEEGKQTPNSTLLKIHDFSGNCNKKKQIKRTKVSKAFPHMKTSMGSAEPLIGLRLGKRTYFENKVAEGNVKKTKPLGQNINMPRCVVEGCEIDLSMAKVYHQKHRVCEFHSKCLKVIVEGLECRFCQQCSRFHNLSEFDKEKRSCRRRLSDHNARRRKPQPERTIQFNSARHSSLPFYGERHHLSFRLNDSPLIHSRNYVDTTWDSTRSSKFTLTTGHPQKSTEEGGISNMLDTMQPLVPDVLNPGSKGSPISSDLDALSLLSNNKWGLLHGNGTMHTIPEAASPELCSNLQETQLIPLVNPYELAELYSQILK